MMWHAHAFFRPNLIPLPSIFFYLFFFLFYFLKNKPNNDMAHQTN